MKIWFILYYYILYIFDAHHLEIPLEISVLQFLLNISVILTTQNVLLEKSVKKSKAKQFQQSLEIFQYTINIMVQNHAFLWLITVSGECSIQKVSCMKKYLWVWITRKKSIPSNIKWMSRHLHRKVWTFYCAI